MRLHVRGYVADCAPTAVSIARMRKAQKLTVPGVFIVGSRARWAVPKPIDGPGFFFGVAKVIRASRRSVVDGYSARKACKLTRLGCLWRF